MRRRIVGEALKRRGSRRTANVTVGQSVIQLVLLRTVNIGVRDVSITYTQIIHEIAKVAV